MSIICSKCNFTFEKDIKFAGSVIEQYQNIYGTRCPKCNYLIKPIYKPAFVEKNELQLEQNRNEFLLKMRNKIRDI